MPPNCLVVTRRVNNPREYRKLAEGLERQLAENARIQVEQIESCYSKLAVTMAHLEGEKAPISRAVSLCEVARASMRWLNSAALVLSIIGACMVWLWGLPQPSFGPSGVIRGSADTIQRSGLTNAQVDANTRAHKRHYRHMSETGMALIVIGFVGQLVGEVAEQRRRRSARNSSGTV